MKIRLLFITIIFLLSTLSAHAQSSAIDNGLSWLNTQQNFDGSLGNITSTTDIPAQQSQ
jgi:prenyltransferase beta subunit